MLILAFNSDADRSKNLVLMFGLGMLGSAVKTNLLNNGFSVLADMKFYWEEPDRWERVFDSIRRTCLGCAGPVARLTVMWSAGKAGFHCAEDDARSENESFLAVVEFVKALRPTLGSPEFSFHFISSAGGLFEGQRLVHRNSIPIPARPYGYLKLAQEEVLQKAFGGSELAIYRPSSVFGPMVQSAQKGLINNLVNNGLRGRLTVLDANVMSLRDYVYSGDIGRFVAQRIRNGIVDETIKFLVSSRCTSIFEVVHIVQRVLKIRLLVRFDESFGNHSNITFSESCLSSGWAPTTLSAGIRQFVLGGAANTPVTARH